ncbi:hypothetical protein C1646_676537 [Rhizophagus diaphanus]|nr:hypothetical protein C1646_676537 [Rhizophagus diaphanus] [Rhizophagus sp. MUCL 43196]
MMLNCFVLDTEVHFPIPLDEKVSVGKYEYSIESLSISILKKYIWEREEEILKDLTNNVSKLDLWHVNVEKVVNVSNEDDIVRKLGGNKMEPNFLLSDYFSVSDPPPKRNINIIIHRPTTTVSPMYIPSNELKTEIKNKVIETFPHMNVLLTDQLVDALALIWHVETMESDSPGPQDDPYFNLKTEPSFFKTNLPRNITKQTSTTVDLCLPSYSKSGTNYHNPFYDDPQFKETVSLVLKKIEDRSKDIIVLAGVSGGGKTSTAFGIAVERWSIYIDFSPDSGYYQGSQLQSELQKIRGIKPKFDRIDQQNDAFHMLDMAVVSRGLLLIKMFIEGKISTPKEWLLAQLQMDDSEIRRVLGSKRYDTLAITTLIKKINVCLNVNHLTLICDEAQVLCANEYGKYQGSSVLGKKWNLLQGYVAHLLQHPIKCLLSGTYMHMASGISLVTSVGKEPSLQTHIVLKLPFLLHDDVLWNLNAVIDLTHVTPETCGLLGNLLKGRPRNCASFVRLLISTQRSNGKKKDQVLRELILVWQDRICSSMADYLENACEYFGADNLHSEKAIMDVLRLRVFYNHRFKEAIELLQHSIIPCQSPKCIVLGQVYDEIEINSSFESFLIDSIKLFLEQKRKTKMIDVFVDNIIMLNNVTSIGNEFDAVFITAIIEKRDSYVRDELDKWKNGQQFDIPSWITPKMKFVTTSNLSNGVHITQYVKDIVTYSSYAIQPEQRSGSDVVLSLMDDKQNVVLLSAGCTVSSSGSITKKKVKDQLIKSCLRFQYIECPNDTPKKKPKRLKISLDANLPKDDTANEEDNLEGEKDEEYGQDLNYVGLNHDLDYTNNTKGYKISDVSNHNQINTFISGRKHIYISVELPHRAESKRSELFRLNAYGDLVIIVDDRNVKHVFGEGIAKLMENLRQRDKNQDSSKKRKNE